jgi:exodeoxyribonuclease-5
VSGGRQDQGDQERSQDAPEWSPQQKEAIDKIRAWLRGWPDHQKQLFKLYGYAGTGKTTLARHAVAESPNPVATALSGKAAAVLHDKGWPDAAHIHTLAYSVQRAEEPEEVGFEYEVEPFALVEAEIGEPVRPEKGAVPEFEVDPKGIENASVIVVDEASMVPDDIVADLLSFGTPILALGDPAQLPPPSGFGSLTAGEPDIFLREIHRQARDNPIIQLSMLARQGKPLPEGRFGESFVSHRPVSFERIAESTADIVLCGRNKTRARLNELIRQRQGRRSSWPEAGEKLVALRNERGFDGAPPPILNGSMWTILDFRTLEDDDGLPWVRIAIEPKGGGERLTRHYPAETFFAKFDFGYALTTHKSQGSEWPMSSLSTNRSAGSETATAKSTAGSIRRSPARRARSWWSAARGG